MKSILFVLTFITLVSCGERETACTVEKWTRTATYAVNFPQELVYATEWEYTGEKSESDYCYGKETILNGGSSNSVHIPGDTTWTRIEYQYRVN